MYKPLPKTVVVKKSAIHGYGLFAVADIPRLTDLGVSHVFAVGFLDDHIRTPLGGFINHSDIPNCRKVKSHDDSALTYYNLHTTKNIKEGDELTVTYTIYEIEVAMHDYDVNREKLEEMCWGTIQDKNKHGDN